LCCWPAGPPCPSPGCIAAIRSSPPTPAPARPGPEPVAAVLVHHDTNRYNLKVSTAHGSAVIHTTTTHLTLRVVQALPDGSYLSFLPDPKVRQRRAVQLAKGGYVEEQTGIPVRVVEYEVDGQGDSGEIFCLVTTLTDPEEITAVELAAAYRQRWEFETALDELEIHQRGPARILRSKSAEMVKQEIWALLLTHYAIRDLICQAVGHADIDPDRLSFIRSLRVIRPAGNRPDGVFP
jgi:hypothetical protein